MDSLSLVDTLCFPDDPITSVVPIAKEPYVLVGCRSGSVRTAQMCDATGEPVREACPVMKLKTMPHTSTCGWHQPGCSCSGVVGGCRAGEGLSLVAWMPERESWVVG